MPFSWNPLNWIDDIFDISGKSSVENAAASNFELYQRMQADHEAGNITDAQWQQFQEIYMKSTGGYMPDSADDASNQVTNQVYGEINSATAAAITTLPEQTAELLGRTVGTAANTAGKAGASFFGALPAWLKWTAILGATGYALYALNNAGLLAPAVKQAKKALK